jgi:hypothetical protein
MTTYLPHAFTRPTLDPARPPASLQALRRRWQTRRRAVFGKIVGLNPTHEERQLRMFAARAVVAFDETCLRPE